MVLRLLKEQYPCYLTDESWPLSGVRLVYIGGSTYDNKVTWTTKEIHYNGYKRKFLFELYAKLAKECQ